MRTCSTIATAALLLGCASHSTTGGAPPVPRAPTSTTATTTPASPAALPAATAKPGVQSTLMGVYTDVQATAGREVYAGRCQSCHSGEHSSSVFRHKWAGKTLENLWGLIRTTMPDDDPGGLSDEQYSAVVAYLLKLNGMPSGAMPLPADSLALKNIRLDTLTQR